MAELTMEKWENFQKLTEESLEKDRKITLDILKENGIEIDFQSFADLIKYDGKTIYARGHDDGSTYVMGRSLIYLLKSFMKRKNEVDPKAVLKYKALKEKISDSKKLFSTLSQKINQRKLKEFSGLVEKIEDYLDSEPYFSVVEKTLEDFNQMEDTFNYTYNLVKARGDVNSKAYYNSEKLKEMIESGRINYTIPETVNNIEELMNNVPDYTKKPKAVVKPKEQNVPEEQSGPAM